ncbi:hypothetical protein B2J88_40800 [Rhodococcus sp. SRB_17]|nr:hypothetical protein [Rhodococcus sp. SRB_17]
MVQGAASFGIATSFRRFLLEDGIGARESSIGWCERSLLQNSTTMSSPFLIGSLKQLTGYRQYLFGCYTEMVTSRHLVDRYFSIRSYRSMILVMM